MDRGQTEICELKRTSQRRSKKFRGSLETQSEATVKTCGAV